MRPADFSFDLPESQIALHPAEPRDASRLMAIERKTGRWQHRKFTDLTELLRAGDLLVFNNTRVLPARLFAESDSGRKFEVLLLKEQSPLVWKCLAKPGKKVGSPTTLTWPGGVAAALAPLGERGFQIRFSGIDPGYFLNWLRQTGKIPLPPYLKRPATDADQEHYQTIFARDPASVAAPTAGLHFTQALLAKIKAQGVRTAEVTLEIGYGTFAPIQSESLDDHKMHEETYHIPPTTLEALESARTQGRRVIALGTTTLRALESLDLLGPQGDTSIFIRPGYSFRRVDGLITNFHLPESTLLILVCAFLGKEASLSAYAEAVREGYRFFSYGDAMAILP